jgi:TRAP-type C4-dicarboxylate transport system permease small subunit
MKVTFFALIMPFLIWTAEYFTGTLTPPGAHFTTSDNWLALWMFGGLAVTCVYWCFRLVARAFRDGRRSDYQRLDRL